MDQSNDVPAQSYLGSTEQQAQTFTAGRDGSLDRVEVKGFRSSSPGALSVQITAVDGSGAPTGAALGAGSADTTTLPTFTGDLSGGGWLSVDIIPAVQVHAGTQYAIVSPTTSPFHFLWSLSIGDTYPAGAGSPPLGQAYDYLFRTFVLTPEPAATCEGRDPTIYVKDAMVVGGPDSGKPYTGTLRGSTAADVILGTSGADVMSGGNGDDVICGSGGNDTIKGGNGNDALIGGDGQDLLDGGNGNDVLTGGADADAFIGGRGADTATDYSLSEGDTQRSIP
ncbi:calcium-binding protein [Humibacillus xanthopallidus]|uniref:calcium-binding protein n=1 Tax=Humibacillus xanthopallidus TaxID=412689 RepID=UPI001C89B9C9|nr:calcium-binding protein [Humibacillus xanthopallidus]